MSMSHAAKRYARYAAFGAVGGALALSPLGVSYADEEPANADGTSPVTVTATVTAVIAPDQCEPLPDGRLPQRAVDYANADGDVVIPTTTSAPAPADAATPPALFAGNTVMMPLAPATTTSAAPDADEEKDGDEEKGPIQGTGPFDPYLCNPAAATPETTTITPEPVAPGPALEDLPGVTPTLRQYPSNNGLTDGPVSTAGPQLGAADPSARPTEEPLPGTGALQPGPRPLS